MNLEGLSDVPINRNSRWGPYSNTASYASIPLSVKAGIERVSSASGDQTLKSHWQLPTSGYLSASYKERRVLELWVKYASGWFLCDWVTLTLDFNSVYVLRDPASTGYGYGNLSNLGKTIHLYELGGQLGPMFGGSSERLGGIEESPESSCPTCEEATGAPQFDRHSRVHPYQQCGIANVEGGNTSLNVKIGMGQAGFGRIGGRLSLYSQHPSSDPAKSIGTDLGRGQGP